MVSEVCWISHAWADPTITLQAMCPPMVDFCCDNSRQNSLLSALYIPTCALEDTVTILAGAERIIRGRRRQVNRKWPRWFTPNWVSNPSSVLPWGHAIIPETSAPHDNRMDTLCHFRLDTHFPWPVYGVVSVVCSLRRPNVRPFVVFLCVCKWFWGSSSLNIHAVKLPKPRVNEFSFQCIYYVDGSHWLHIGNYHSSTRHTTHTYKIFRT